MEKITDFYHAEFLGNTVLAYGIALAVLAVSTAAVHLVGRFALSRLKPSAQKTSPAFGGSLLKIFQESLFPLLYLGAFYFAAKQLVLNAFAGKLLFGFAVVTLTVLGIRLGLALLVFYLESRGLKQENKNENSAAFKSILTIVKASVWGVGAVFILDNLGFNVAAIVAGLGIGGIAVALACQTILGDLFNYFVIFFDKPFREGDFIVWGDLMGTIEDIGLKSTRVRALSGEEIVVSNSNLTSGILRNFRRMNQRRIEFSFQVSHGTSQAQLKKIPQMVRGVIEEMEGVKFDRAHFKEVKDTGLVVEAVYYFLDADFNKYMDCQQRVNLEIREALLKEGVEFASPRLAFSSQEV